MHKTPPDQTLLYCGLIRVAVTLQKIFLTFLLPVPLEVTINSRNPESLLGDQAIFLGPHGFSARVDRALFALFGLVLFYVHLPHRMIAFRTRHATKLMTVYSTATVLELILCTVFSKLLYTPLVFGLLTYWMASISLYIFTYSAVFIALYTHGLAIATLGVALNMPQYRGGISLPVFHFVIITVCLLLLPNILVCVRFHFFGKAIINRQQLGLIPATDDAPIELLDGATDITEEAMQSSVPTWREVHNGDGHTEGPEPMTFFP